MPQVSDEIIFLAIILGIAISILVSLLVATFAIFRTGTQMGKERSGTSLAENTSAPIPQDEIKEESILLLPASDVIISALGNGQRNTFKIKQRAINLLRVPIAVALMMGLILLLTLMTPTGKVRVEMSLESWFWSILVVFIGIGGGGAIGVRIAYLSWRQTVLSALLTSAGVMLVSRFEISPFYIGLRDFSEGNFQFYPFLIGTLAVSAPAFLLPFCDPVLRQSGPASSVVKVVFAALVISGMFVLSLPIAVGVFVGFTCFLLGMGLVLSLYRPMNTAGAELGGLGLVLLPFSSFAWLAYFSGSFS